MCDILYIRYIVDDGGQTAEIDEVDYRRHTLVARGNRYLIIVRYSTRESSSSREFPSFRIANPTRPTPSFLLAPLGLQDELVHEVKHKVKDSVCMLSIYLSNGEIYGSKALAPEKHCAHSKDLLSHSLKICFKSNSLRDTYM